jgi:hypothetical protein
MNEERRFALHERLEAMLGATDANTLMEHLPPTTWSDLVRQRDVDMLRISVSSDMAVMRSDLRGEINDLRSELKHEMNELRNELRGEMNELRTELRGEMASLRNDLTREMDRRFTKQMWQFITTTIGLQALTIASIGVMFANMN